MKVLFVGSNPSPKNIDAAVPFDGTASGKVLKRWIMELGLYQHEYSILNLSDKILSGKERLKQSDWNLRRLDLAIGPRTLPIGLGRNAQEALRKSGNVYLSLPHPSPRNRVLNDKAKLSAILLATKWQIALWDTL